MKEVQGNIWDYHDKGYWIVITTNGTVCIAGDAVMGKGIAREAKRRFPGLPHMLGKTISETGNVLHHWGQQGLLFFPTKHNWWDKANLALIEKSAQQLEDFFNNVIGEYPTPIYLPRPGCGEGKLNWEDVKPILEKYLDDRFIVVEIKEGLK